MSVRRPPSSQSSSGSLPGTSPDLATLRLRLFVNDAHHNALGTPRRLDERVTQKRHSQRLLATPLGASRAASLAASTLSAQPVVAQSEPSAFQHQPARLALLTTNGEAGTHDGSAEGQGLGWATTATMLRLHEHSANLGAHPTDVAAALVALRDLGESLSSDPTAYSVLTRATEVLCYHIFSTPGSFATPTTGASSLTSSAGHDVRQTYRDEALTLRRNCAELKDRVTVLEREVAKRDAIDAAAQHSGSEGQASGNAAESSPLLRSLVEENSALHAALREEKIAHRTTAVALEYYQAQLADVRHTLLSITDVHRGEEWLNAAEGEHDAVHSAAAAVRLLRENAADVAQLFTEEPSISVNIGGDGPAS